MDKNALEILLNENVKLNSIKEFTVFEDKNDFLKIKNGNKILIDGQEVYVEFLKKVLDNDEYYDKILKYFDDESMQFQFGYIINGELFGKTSYDKITIIHGLNYLLKNSENIFTDKMKDRMNILASKVDYYKFVKNNQGNIFDIEIDNIKYSISIDTIFEVMNMLPEDFEAMCYDSRVKDIDGIPKDHFIYAVKTYMEDSGVLKNYDLPFEVSNCYKDIISGQFIDIEAINQYLFTEDTIYKNFDIDKSLHDTILSNMPEDYSKLEKACYIYINMCKTLTYDEEFYASNQEGPVAERHVNPNHLVNITPNSNGAVCFELNVLYQKLLAEQGIISKIDYYMGDESKYGLGHSVISFRADKFLIQADFVKSIFQGDLVNAKLNQELNGIKSLNKDSTNYEFKETLKDVYKNIIKKEKGIESEIENPQTLNELLSEYGAQTSNYTNIPIERKLDIMINKVNESGMNGIDSLGYLFQLRNILFNEKEKEQNFGITVLSDKTGDVGGDGAKPSAIIYKCNKNMWEYVEDIDYYVYTPNNPLKNVTCEEIQYSFDSSDFSYITTTKKKSFIPGIVEKEGLDK